MPSSRSAVRSTRGSKKMIDPDSDALVLGVAGAGAMGRGIAQLAAAAGVTVLLFDAREGAAREAAENLSATFAMLAKKGKIGRDKADAATALLRPVASLEEFASCHVAVEAIVEALEAKRALFASIEAVVTDDCVLATNTSSLPVTAIAAACRHPERVAGFHFFNPAPLMKIVEVVPGMLTADWVTDFLVKLGRRMGHSVARTRDTPGFLINHAGRGYNTEALRIAGEGVASPADIDRVLVEQAGFRMGAFQLFDLIGVDVVKTVTESLYEQFFHEPRYRPSILLRQYAAADLLGRKTGRGFYAYADGKPVLPPEPSPPPPGDRPVWVSGRDAAAHAALTAVLRDCGATIDAGGRPTDGSICLAAPIGEDATTACLAEDLDPANTFAVDTLFGLDKRRVVMTTPGADPAMRDALHGLLAADGRKVTVIHDSPGFISQRVVASIVNVACDIAQQRIATPTDIDMAVPLGLGYPEGPLSIGDRLGPARILSILEKLQTLTGDPRYRPSLWLSRRARLGMPLVAPEA